MNTTKRSIRSAPTTIIAVLLGLLLILLVSGLVAAGRPRSQYRPGGITPNDISRDNDVYVVSFEGSGKIAPDCWTGTSHVSYGPGDVLLYDAKFKCWAEWFSATRSGLNRGHNINASHDECVFEPNTCDIYLSFSQNNIHVPGIGRVPGQDIVKASWVPDTLDSYDNFQTFFDGSDAGLEEKSERIDALYLFDQGEEPAELGCYRLLLISTVGPYSVPDGWGGWITGGGEDVLGYCASWLGANTAGYWFLYHDGSAEGLPRNALIALTHEDGRLAFSRFEFLTNGDFKADSANGGHSEVFNFFGQTGAYDGPTFSFPDYAGTRRVIDSMTVFHLP